MGFLQVWVVISVVLAASMDMSYGFPTGAPDDDNLCNSMIPNHGAPNDDIGASPIEVTVSPSEYEGGEDIDITLTRSDGGNFKGFLITVRTAGDTRVGTLSVPASQSDAKVICSDEGATHTGDDDKTSVTVHYQAPADPAGHLGVFVTMVESYAPGNSVSVFWAKIRGATIIDPTDDTDPDPGSGGNGGSGTAGEVTDINDSDCGTNKGCYRNPANCLPEECGFLVTWQVSGDNVDFEMSASLESNEQWVAVGISNDQSMGDDSVTQCVFNSGTSEVEVSNTYNDGKSNVPITDPSAGLVGSTSGAYADGKIVCQFTRAMAPNTDRVFDLNKEYYILMARGRASGSSKFQHAGDGRVVATQAVDFSSTDYVTIGGSASYPLVKAHACLMILAWMLFASIGVLMPRYFKPHWANHEIMKLKLWFQLHRLMMVLVVSCTIAAFVIIFVEVQGYANFPSSPDNVHPPLGIAVTILALANPCIALLRCGPDHPRRPIFNWVHFLVGEGAHVCGITTIFLGTYLAKSNAPSSTRIIIIIYIVAHVLTEIALAIYTHCLGNGKKRAKDEMEMDGGGAQAPLKDAPSKGAERFKTGVLLIYGLITAGLSVALVIILIMA